MRKRSLMANLSIVIMLGAVWGFSEIALGIVLRKCASLVSGSIMTGVALFFLATTWALTRRVFTLFLLVALTCFLKMFDAILLHLPFNSSAVTNPIFAFLLEGLAFLILLSIIKEKLKQKKGGQALLGGMSALLAALLFPLANYATGSPACVFPKLGIPLSIVFAPLAICVSSLTVPFGFYSGTKIETLETKMKALEQPQRLYYFVSSATLILSLAIIILIRKGSL